MMNDVNNESTEYTKCVYCGEILIIDHDCCKYCGERVDDKQIAENDEFKRQYEAMKVQLKGELNPLLICPHCQTKGSVHIKEVTKKEGIHGGKVIGGILTGGWSLLATGLSNKNLYSQAFCYNCNTTWSYIK